MQWLFQLDSPTLNLQITYSILTSVNTYAARLTGQEFFTLPIRLLWGHAPVITTLIGHTALV